MRVEIDQSGKLEQLNTPTIVAYANGKSGATRLTAAAKRRILHQLRRSLVPEKEVEAIWFAVVIFLLVKDLPQTATLVIDQEYTGKEKIVEQSLTKLLQQQSSGRWRGSIRFQRIGKHSPAHRLAWRARRGLSNIEVTKLSEDEVLKFLK